VRRKVNGGIRQLTLTGTGPAVWISQADLPPAAARIVRAEVTKTDLPTVGVGQSVSIVLEADQSKAYPGAALSRAAVFGARKLQSDDPAERTDERVVELW
jgi:HlyD family secretion protein